MKFASNLLLSMICASTSLFGSMLANAEPQLYDTGPTDVMSFVRFLNATDESVSVVSAQGAAKIDLTTQTTGRISGYFAVKSDVTLLATIRGINKKQAVQLTGKPWEYITVAILPNGAQLKTTLVRESPTDFNAMRTSLALFNLDTQCSCATLLGGTKNTPVLENTPPFEVRRRLVNPIKLAASIRCDAKSTAVPIDFSQLQAGGRYSIFIVTNENIRSAFFVIDDH